MHILITVSHLRKGGLVNVVYNQCKQLLQKNNCKLTIVSLRPEGNNTRIEDFRQLGIEVIQLNKPYWVCELKPGRVRKQIETIANTKNIDIIHCHGYHSVLVCAPIDTVKIMATLHDRANEDFINVFGKVLGNVMLHRYIKALKQLTLPIAVSKSTMDLYQSLGVTHTTYVNNGIDTDIFKYATDLQIKDFRASIGIPIEDVVFITSGRIEKEKRYTQLVSYFNNRIQCENIWLIVLGSGNLLEECKHICKNNKRIIFTGMIKNVKEYLQCADYYVSYSLSEGMSMAVCEAIGCGLLPILSDIPSHNDVVDTLPDSDLGYIFKHIYELDRMQFKHINTNQRKTLHQFIQNNFSCQTMGDGYYRCYQEA